MQLYPIWRINCVIRPRDLRSRFRVTAFGIRPWKSLLRAYCIAIIKTLFPLELGANIFKICVNMTD